MKHNIFNSFITLAAVLLFSTTTFSQTNPPFGSDSGSGSPSSTGKFDAKTDSVHPDISKRIFAYLEECGIKTKPTITKLSNKTYFVMEPLKLFDGINIIWVDFYFDVAGFWMRKVTKISDVDDVDCDVIPEAICAGIPKLKEGFKKEFGTELTGIIYVHESTRSSYFEVYRQGEDYDVKEKFDFDGKPIL